MQISGCCRKNESSADVPPFCVPPITKSTRMFQPQIDTDFHRFCKIDGVVAAFVLKRRTKKTGAWHKHLYNFLVKVTFAADTRRSQQARPQRKRHLPPTATKTSD